MDADKLSFTRKTVRDSWTVLETDFFVQCYNLYKNEIGKNKRFKSKKNLFSWIAGEMATSIQSTKTEKQLSSRFYILTRQNKKSVPVITDVMELPWTQISSDNLALCTSTSDSVVFETSINMSGASAVDINYSSINKASFVNQTELASMVDMNEELVIHLDDVSAVDMNRKIVADENETSTFDADESAVVRTKAPIDPINVGIGTVFNKNNGISLDNTGSSNVSRSFENVACTSTSGVMSERPIMRIAGALSLAGYSSSAQTSSCADSSPLATVGECSNSSRSRSISGSSDRATSLIDTSVLSRSADNWTTDETKFLLHQYYYYINEVGPMKSYRTKKDMWVHVARQMADIFEKNWTWEQLSKRVKTIIDRKKASVERNRKSEDFSPLATIGECSNFSRSRSLAGSSDRATSLIDTSVLSRSADNWTTDETKFLLDQYYYYIDEVGPMKLYRTKKDMWEHLARQMADIFEKNWTWEQLSKRVKTIIDRKKASVERNQKSGATRIDVEYEEEINKIAAVDDSTEPEVLRGINFVHYKEGRKKNDQPTTKKPRWDKPNKKGVLNTLSEAILSIETRRSEKDKLKEERREQMHEEKMEILRSLKRRE